MTTMLSLVQQATGEMGLAVPTQVAGNTSTDVVQILALLNAVGYELKSQFEWEALTKEYRFTAQYLTTTGSTTNNSAIVTSLGSTTGLDSTYMLSGLGINNDTYVQTVDSATQVTLNQAATQTNTGITLNFGKTKYAMPSDYDRQIDRTHYDKSKRWEMIGPESPQQWQFLKSSYISTGPRLRYRILGGYFQIWPMVTTSEYLGFEYISKNWATSSGGTSKAAFTADDDTCIYPDRLMVLGLKHKYFMVKGFGDIFRDEYEAELGMAKTADHGSATLSLAPQINDILIGWDNIPDTNFGS